MAANFSSYDQVEQPSLTGEMFGSPAKAWWTLQKGSLYANVLNGSMWGGASKGLGIKWGGVVGFRGIALGQGAAGMKTASPSKLIAGLIKPFSSKQAEAFENYGLFGSKSGATNALGRVLGGGIIDGTKFKPRTKLEIEKIKWSKVKDMTEKNFAPEVEMKYFNKLNDLGKKTLFQQKLVKRIATVGKFASWATFASLAFDVGSAIGGFAVNTLGNAADRFEKSMSNVFNRQMEFGGKVGVGFYSGASGTERQRALSAIGRGGGPGMGNEAGYQHIDSTW